MTQLSPRERQIFRLYANGLTNKCVARELGISVHTVKDHAYTGRLKLGAGTTVQAVVTAQRMGLL